LHCLTIASGQLCIGALLAGSGVLLRMSVTGGVISLIAISPLGLGSAFLPTPLMAVALIVMRHRLVQGSSA